MVELAALDYLRQLGWSTAFGPSIAPDSPGAERSSYEQVYLYGRLRDAAARINPDLAPSVVEEAVKRLERA
jgi:type I restriction enzyme R subunit